MNRKKNIKDLHVPKSQKKKRKIFKGKATRPKQTFHTKFNIKRENCNSISSGKSKEIQKTERK